MIPNSLRLPFILLILALPGCGSGDLVLPGGPPTGLTPVSGDRQSGLLGSRLPDPLVVKVTDAEGRLVAGTSVEFSFVAEIPGGAVTPQTATTDEQGQASAEVQLGTVEGDQPVEARVAGGVDSTLRARFSLTALPLNDGGGGGGNGGGGHGHDHDEGDGGKGGDH